MNKVLKWVLSILLGLVALLIILYYAGREYVRDKIEEEVVSLCEKSNITYKNLEIDLIGNTILINAPQTSNKGESLQNHNFDCQLENIKLQGLDFKEYISNKRISFKSVTLQSPELLYYINDSLNNQNSKNNLEFKSNSKVSIENFHINNAKLKVFNALNDSLISQTEDFNLEINGVLISDTISNEGITYDEIKLTAKNLQLNLGNFEKLKIENVESDLKNVSLKNIEIKTKYSQKEYSKILDKERDWYHTMIDSAIISNVNIAKKDSLKDYSATLISLFQPSIQIYRNKLVANNYDYKPFYSKMLRDIPCFFHIDTIAVVNASVLYNEKVSYSSSQAQISFSQLNGSINNFGNIFLDNKNNKTEIQLSGKFMDVASIDVDWKFDVSDEKDNFIFKANIGSINASRFNQFIEPQINAVLSGTLKKTYFTVSGNEYASNIDMKLNYDDFKVTVFKKDSNEKNKLLSGLANLFIKKTTEREDDNFRETSKSGIRRDVSKSFFNFVWLNVREGLILAMIGDASQ